MAFDVSDAVFTIQGPTAWLPTDIAGCVLWLRSDLGITKDGSNRISQWADQSGLGHNLSQIDTDRQPVWTDNQVNGYPSLIFDGIDDKLGPNTFTLNNPVHVFIVVKQISWTIGDRIFDGSIQNYMSLFQYDASPKLSLYPTSDYATVFLSGLIIGSFGILCALQGTNGNLSYIKLNGGTETANYTSISVNDPAGFTIGGFGDNTGQSSNISVPEVIIYNTILSDVNRQRVELYLNTESQGNGYAIY